jgi:hypothetical protein
MKIAAVAAGMFLAFALPARAQPVSANDTARFLAGLPPSADSPLTPLTKDPSWQRHAKFFDNAFGQFEQRQLSKIRSWADANLAAPKPTMYYMFSGPDFLYANAFYPKASTYVLSALEPIGAVPDLMRLPRGGIGGTLNNVERSLSTIINYSFFITDHMHSDLRAGQINGALPILYVFLARSGKTIRDVTLVTLDDSGAFLPEATTTGKNLAQGVKILFAGSDGAERTLYYFSTNISDPGLKSSGFLKFCETLAPGNSLIKSASYLPHKPNFAIVRAFLLNNSATMIQDDSGIPLSYYDHAKWKFFPFGHYVGPIGPFAGKYQPKYAELFQKSQPMDFGVGYRWRPHESNLLLAVRLPSDGPGGVEATASTEPRRERPARVRATASTEPRREKPARPKRPRAPPQAAAPSGFWWFGQPPR